MTLRAMLCITLVSVSSAVAGCSGGDDDDDGATPLAAPANVAASTGDHRIVLTWDAVPDAVGYRVYEADSAGVNVATLTPIEVAVTTVERTPAANWTPKYYRVRAVGTGRPSSDLSAEVSAFGNAGWIISGRRNAGVRVAVQRYHADEPNAPVDEIADAELVTNGVIPVPPAVGQGVGASAVLYGIGPTNAYSEIGIFRSSERVVLANQATHAYRVLAYEELASGPRVFLEDLAGGVRTVLSVSATGDDTRLLKTGCSALTEVKSSSTGVVFGCDEGTAFDYWASNGLDAAVKLPGAAASARTPTHVIGSRVFFYTTATKSLSSQLLDGTGAEAQFESDNVDERLVTYLDGPNVGKPIVGSGNRVLMFNVGGVNAYDLISVGLDGSNPAPILINGRPPAVTSVSPDGSRFTVVRLDLAGTTSFAFSYTFDASATQAVLSPGQSANDARFLENGNILVFKATDGPTIVDPAGAVVDALGLSPSYIWNSNKGGYVVLHYPALGDLTAVRLTDVMPYALSETAPSPLASQFGDEGHVVFVDSAKLPWIAHPDVALLKQTIDTDPTTRVTPIGIGEGNRVFLQLRRDVSPYFPADLVMFDLDTKTSTPLVSGATDDVGVFFPN